MPYLSDLAVERRRADTSLSDVTFAEQREGAFTVSHLRVTGEAGAESIGKPMGLYITISHPLPSLMSHKEKQDLARAVGRAIRECLPSSPRRLLIAGLGNRHLAADALGCAAADGVEATAHIAVADAGLFRALDCAAIATFSPNVMGESGLEAADTVRAVAKEFQADAVVAFDALAAGAPERLLTTVQVTSSGIAPGAGIGNRRPALNDETVGCPVIGIGVPTVMRAAAYLAHHTELTASHAPPCSTREDEGLFVQRQGTDTEVALLGAVLADGINRTFGIVQE